MQLVLCDRCARHLRIGERLCPFCGVKRAAIGVALGVALASCGGATATSETTPSENGAEEQPAPSPPGDESTPPESDEETPPEAREDTPPQRGPDGVGAIAAYGAPAPDGPEQSP